MKAVEARLPRDWRIGVKVSAERAGQVILGKGHLELLESIDRCHSISAAARDLGISYRHAWLMVQAMNDAPGEPLVVSATGGHHGGGAQLTHLGQWTRAFFRQLQTELHQTAAVRLRDATATVPSDTIHVAAAVCLEEVLGQLLIDFRIRSPECRVRTVFGASDELADHVLGGAPTDLFITAGPEPLNRLEAAGVTQHQSRTVLAETTLAAIGPVDRDLPIHTSADLVRPGADRIALADPSCPLGRYTHDYLSGLKLSERLKGRLVYVENSRAVGAAVRAGSADVGLVYASDAHRTADCRLLFKVKKTASPIQFCGAVVGQGRQAQRGQTLLDFLASQTAAQRFQHCGFLPAR